ncbi:hypothetical protein HMPREF0973_00912 [Prevotella veroralis F0319]|uniref:Uncharacterized protein n=1 Tax=Prevotella veroralis F0319 TaxID=649761 RepID=C9MMS8_9BACT|nr:hypothetical protein HMPREF0973_00912 [Prevotella veroralis F0319]
MQTSTKECSHSLCQVQLSLCKDNANEYKGMLACTLSSAA